MNGIQYVRNGMPRRTQSSVSLSSGATASSCGGPWRISPETLFALSWIVTNTSRRPTRSSVSTGCCAQALPAVLGTGATVPTERLSRGALSCGVSTASARRQPLGNVTSNPRRSSV